MLNSLAAISAALLLLGAQLVSAAASDSAYTIGRPTNADTLANAVLASAQGKSIFKCDEVQLKGTASGLSFKKKPKVEENPFQKK